MLESLGGERSRGKNLTSVLIVGTNLLGSKCENAFVFSVGIHETTAGCVFSAVPVPCLS